jgi:putative endonuclease
MYYTYVLYSSKFNKIYVGFSGDLHNRLLIHNGLQNTGWTAKYQPWEILYSEEFETKPEAMKREKQLKSSRGRVFIWEMVKNKNIGNQT